MLDIEFDPDKNLANVLRHDISLSATTQFELADAVKWEDDREDYGEIRMIAIGRLRRDIYRLTYTERGARVRAISLQKASKPERAEFLAHHG